MTTDATPSSRLAAEQAADELIAHEQQRHLASRVRRARFLRTFPAAELAVYSREQRAQILSQTRQSLVRDWAFWFWVLVECAALLGALAFVWTDAARPPVPAPVFYALVVLAGLGIRTVRNRHLGRLLSATPIAR